MPTSPNAGYDTDSGSPLKMRSGWYLDVVPLVIKLFFTFILIFHDLFLFSIVTFLLTESRGPTFLYFTDAESKYSFETGSYKNQFQHSIKILNKYANALITYI